MQLCDINPVCANRPPGDGKKFDHRREWNPSDWRRNEIGGRNKGAGVRSAVEFMEFSDVFCRQTSKIPGDLTFVFGWDSQIVHSDVSGRTILGAHL